MHTDGWSEAGNWTCAITGRPTSPHGALNVKFTHIGCSKAGAVQDVWIMPHRADRVAHLDKTMNMYGTSLRVWDPLIQSWRITWRNPAGDHHEEQIGRR